MQKLAPSMTRTAFCQNCEKAGYPKKHTAYAVYAGSHKSYSLRLHVGYISKKYLGITPHIFFDTLAVIPINKTSKEHHCIIKSLCGVIGCGFDIRWEKEYKMWTLFSTREPDFTHIKSGSIKVLEDFKAPEMYLDVVSSMSSWKIHEIVQEQQRAFQNLHRA